MDAFPLHFKFLDYRGLVPSICSFTAPMICSDVNPNFFSSVSNSTGGQISADYYVIDSGHGFVIETDGGGTDTISPGANPGNLTFGYYATRTPVCQGCP